MTFDEFSFDEALMDGIYSMGYKEPTPVQQQVIPAILSGRDVIAAAQTGTGKTAAFLLPIIQMLITRQHSFHAVNCLIVVPTRELAIQITQTLEGLAYFTDLSFIAVYGGNDGALFSTEKKALTSGADIVIATPGRLLSHLKMGYLQFTDVRYLVLDEADRMLDMGFYPDLEKIINALPSNRQNLFFSATMPSQMRKLANRFLKNPEQVNIAISRPPEQIEQGVFYVYQQQKTAIVEEILSRRRDQSGIIFCSSKQAVKDLTASLTRHGLSCRAIHSDLEQQQREETLLDFRNKKYQALIATNIISRGIDIEDVNFIINYDVPHEGEEYVHRIGRTARASATGAAFTLVGEKEQRRFARIEKLLGTKVKELPVPERLGATPAKGTSERASGRSFSKRRKKR